MEESSAIVKTFAIHIICMFLFRLLVNEFIFLIFLNITLSNQSIIETVEINISKHMH